MRTITENIVPLSVAVISLAMVGLLGFQIASGLVPPTL